MDDAAATPTRSSAASLATALDRLAPYVLSILRIMAALLFLQHGLSKLFGFPSPMAPPSVFTMGWFAGLIEFAGGVLVTLGLFTRVAAFIISGEMAVGYFLVHAPQGFYPYLNHGELAVLYCFVFLYLVLPAPGRGASTRCCGGGRGEAKKLRPGDFALRTIPGCACRAPVFGSLQRTKRQAMWSLRRTRIASLRWQ